MRTVTVGSNQTLVDIAMQAYGSTAGVWLLLQDNAALIDPQSPFVTPGMVLQVREDVFQEAKTLRQAVKEYTRTGRDVAALNPSALLPNFPYRRCGIGYWRIGVEFVVGGTCGVPTPTVPLPTGVVDQYRLCDGVVTFTANDPGAGYAVQWSLDGFATVTATGLTFSPLLAISPTPIPVYVRVMDTTAFVPSAIVTAFAYVEPVFTITTATTLIELTPTEESIEFASFLNVPFTINRTCCDSPVTLTLVQGPDPEQVEVTLPANPATSPFNVRFQPLVTVAEDTPFTLELSGSACGTAGITVPGIIRRPPFQFVNAWDLDGVNDYISVPGAGGQFAFGLGGGFCVEGWVYLDAAGGWIMENFGSDSRGFNISTAGNRFNAVFYGSGGTVTLISTVTLTGRLGTWIHVLYQRVGTTLELYENNVLRQSAAVGASSSNSSTSDLFIGSRNVGGVPQNYLNGRLDEWRIYNRALTSSERAAVYNGGAGNHPPTAALPNLVARYRFDTATPTGPNFILNDSSGNGNNGTSSGISMSPLVPR